MLNSVNSGPTSGLIRSMHQTQGSIGQRVEKIATGAAINSATDGAAGMALVQELEASLRSHQQAARNVGNGTSMLQTMEGGLQSVGGNLSRMRELAVEAANGTLNDEQRSALNDEFQALKSEIDRVSATTEFNGKKLLDGSEGSADIQVGQGADENSRVAVDLADASTESLGSDGASVADAEIGDAASARASLETIDGAIEDVARARSDAGAAQNRLERAAGAAEASSSAAVSAMARIRDADVAKEAAGMVSDQIQSQFQAALLAQGNVEASAALQLLG